MGDTASDSSSSENIGSDEVSKNGIFDHGLDAYRSVTDAEYRSVLESGLMIIDANVLLDLYRYHADTRNELLGVLAKFGNRLWISHQAMGEFWRNRSSILEDPKEIGSVTSDLKGFEDRYRERIRNWASRVGLPAGVTAELIGTVAPAFDAIKEKIRDVGHDAELPTMADTSVDPLINRLDELFKGRVGDPLDHDIKRRVIEDGRQRAKDNRPPGFKDVSKGGNAEGDCIIWHETLQEAKRRKVDVLFITRDVKEDWWRIERRQPRGPHPELVREMRDVAGVRLFMLRPVSLLHHAGVALDFQVSATTVEDVGRITRQSEGILERLAAFESAMPRVNARILRMASLIEDFNKYIVDATPLMASADTMTAKLSVADELATELTPIVEDLAAEALAYLESLGAVDSGTQQVLKLIEDTPRDQWDEGVAEYMNSVVTLADNSIEGIGALEAFGSTTAGTMGFSSKLDVPLTRLQTVVTMMASSRPLFEEWRDKIAALRNKNDS